MKKKDNDEKLLTALELKVMNILWDLGEGFVKEVMEKWEEEPVPAYNTISTVIRILEEKGFVGHHALGRSHRYIPSLSRDDYQKRVMTNVLDNVFSGSVATMISSLVEQRNLSDREIEELKHLIDRAE
jgi:predicted transcriptional regulator